MTTLFRFELAFEGELQGCGLFNGLNDALSESSAAWYHEAFMRRLPCPELAPQPSPYKFWFTRQGLKECFDLLKSLTDDLSKTGWSLMLKTARMKPTHLKKCAYHLDEQQAAIPIMSTVSTNSMIFGESVSDFIEIATASDMDAILSENRKEDD